MNHLSLANRWNVDLIDTEYVKWKENPESLSSDWKAFFEGFELAANKQTNPSSVKNDKSLCIYKFIQAYRTLGHMQAHIYPLGCTPKKIAALDINAFGLNTEDLDTEFNGFSKKKLSLKNIIQKLENTYSGTLACQYMHIQDPKKIEWIQDILEENTIVLDKDVCIRALKKILEAEQFESFLHKKYVGQKRFSLEGSESCLAALDSLIMYSLDLGIQHINIGMAHRGRLNFLANIFNKPLETIFKEFDEHYIPEDLYGDSDVKYHMGWETTYTDSSQKRVHICLASNPSHLEAINPVIQGKTRAYQERDKNDSLAILVHGDAAFCGQGINMEVLNYSQLKGYTTGGTLHIIINNQIGFTTNPEDARSTPYASDILKMIEAPILLVNGEDMHAVLKAVRIGLQYRQTFKQDIIIDIYGYRKHGHNEIDEPTFTQPQLYKIIDNYPKISQIFAKKLAQDISNIDEYTQDQSYIKTLQAALDTVKQEKHTTPTTLPLKFKNKKTEHAYCAKPIVTQVDIELLKQVNKALNTPPDGFNLHPKIERQILSKQEAFLNNTGIDWGFSESLAFGSLLIEGYSIRCSGQDCQRGTFSHRHAVYIDTQHSKTYTPLKTFENEHVNYNIINSPLSEAGILGFEYGYSLVANKTLVVWEAQFGDFANGAQNIIDQFISVGESKWMHSSSLVLLLPHGYQGQGPEHSSARLERYLQACGNDNWIVCHLSTPAHYFHALRRQMLAPYKKPLILMAPKNLLRHKDCVSKIEDFTHGSFLEIIPDANTHIKPQKVIICTGKLYYELMDYKKLYQLNDVAIVRIEQLYPLHTEQLKNILDGYSDYQTLVWCQEEPENMGAWSYMAPILESIKHKAIYAGRASAASTATGKIAIHYLEQTDLIKRAFEC